MKKNNFLFILLFILIFVGLLTAIKNMQIVKVVEVLEPTIFLNEANDLSDAEIVNNLFIMYLEHYKAESILNDKRIIDYKDIKVREVTGLNYKAVFVVSYSVQQHFWSSYWTAGNGYVEDNGWILRKSYYVSLIKEKEQFRMKIIGTGL